MTDRLYRLIFGATMLASLYFDFRFTVYALICLMMIEGLTGWRLSQLLFMLRGLPADSGMYAQASCTTGFEAERIWRILIGAVLVLSYIFFPETLWYMPWFLAFVIFGAGASDVCPALLLMKKAGFR